MTTMGSIVLVSAEKDCPKDFLELVVKSNRSGSGMAVPTDEGILWSRDFSVDSVDDILHMLNEYKTYPRYLYFFETDAEYKEDGFSPFILVTDEKGSPVIVAFVEGEFPSWEQDENTTPYYPSTFHYVDKYLKPKIQQYYELCDGDLEKVRKALDKPIVPAELLQEDGAVVIIPAEGEGHIYSSGLKSVMKYDWGWASECYGYLVNNAAPKVGAGGRLLKSKPSADTAISAAQGAAILTDQLKASSPLPDGKDKAEVKFGKPPVGITRRHERKRWFMKYAGFTPEDYNNINCKPVPIKPEFWHLAEFNQPTKDEPIPKPDTAMAEALAAAASSQKNAEKETGNKHIPTSVPTKGGPSQSIASVMDSATKERLLKQHMMRKNVKEFERTLDQSGKVVNIDEIKAIETTLPTYSEQIARTLDFTLGYQLDELSDLERNFPRALTALAMEWRNALVAARKTIAAQARAAQSAAASGTAEQQQTEQKPQSLAAKRLAASRAKMSAAG